VMSMDSSPGRGSPYDLAQMAAHDAEAAGRFPGPDVYEVLGWMHEILQPETYVEIGILGGHSLGLARPPTVAIGIDPAPAGMDQWSTDTRIFRVTSAEFFAHHDLPFILGGRPVAFALIDGLHIFENAMEDLWNLERYSSPETVIAIHDTIPLNRETASRQRTTEFYTGDVWKMAPFLRRYRPELDLITVETAPTGLTLVRGLNADYNSTWLHGCLAEFAALDMDFFERHRADFLGAVPNHRGLVEAFCQKTPVQSILSSGSAIRSRAR